MIFNIAVLILGALALIYGIKQKIKFWIVVGAVLVGLGLASSAVDLMIPAGDTTNATNTRLPFVINSIMK